MRRRTTRPARSVPPPPDADSLVELIDRAPDVIFRVRLAPKARLEYVNAAVLGATGYSPDECYADAGLAWRLVNPSDRRKLQEMARSRRLPSRPFVVRLTRRDGSPLTAEISLHGVRRRGGAMTAIEGIARDITAAGRTAAAGRATEQFLRVVFEHAPVGLAHVTPDGRFLHVNNRVCEITGFSAEELLARHFRDLAHPDDVGNDALLAQQLRAKQFTQAIIEKRLVRKAGDAVWVKVTASRMRNPGAADCVAVLEPVPPPAAQEAEEQRLSCGGGIELDTDRLEVVWNGRRVPLTLKEVLLLRYLVRHRGEMLARNRLLHDVWGYEHAGRSRTLDVHICRLRRKLPPLADSLVTIGHFGYTLSQGTGGAPVAMGNQ